MKGKQLSTHFNEDEFRCKDGTLKGPDPKLITKLEALRGLVDKPVHVSSGYRSPAYNKKVGGAPKSQHLLGTAADIRVDGMSVNQLADICETLGFGGIGRYPKKGFVHVDTRKGKARWTL